MAKTAKASTKKGFKPVPSTVDFPALERERLAHWYGDGVVNKYLHRNDNSKTTFSFIDGPITANNPMGVHHAWGRSYKDLWQKYHTLKGDAGRYQNGFDCQGLWVEVEVEKELGFKSKKDIETYGVGNFVNMCKERVYKFSGIQTEQTKRLGNFMDWDNSYFTMSDENNYMIWHVLKTCWERGWIYKGHESVPWCPRCETAISQHEMLTEDYKELTHQSIFFALPIEGKDNEHLLVWTTTPWTLPANIAVAVDETFDYVLVEANNGRRYWVVKGKELLLGEGAKVVKEVKGKQLVGLKYQGPFDSLSKVAKVASENKEKFHTVVATDARIMPISTTEGTGLVHTAVSAGTEDFQLGKKLGLPMIPIIEDNADYMNDLDFLSGLNAKKHPEVILDYLQEETNAGKPWVWKIENYTHRYPACWRCKTELVWKVADEWYISMDTPDPSDAKKRTLREELMDTAKKINWLPEFGLDRELDWLKNMHDWLISKKNRYWGLALPIYECPKCGQFEVIGSKDELEKRAVEGWDKFLGNSPHRPWIDEVKIKCSGCGEVVSRISDVGNVWLDAGIVPFSTLHYLEDRKYWEKWFPANFITESFPGQFKNWFYSLIVMSTILTKENPFETVLGYGSLLAEDGRPMHKSWGNSIEFNEGADKIGADVMRWMYAATNPSDNMLFGYKKADEVRRRFFLILWNSYSFFVTYANLANWTPSKTKSKNVLDQWISVRLQQTINIATESLDKFDAMTAAAALEKFVDDLSTWYIRRSRDRAMDEEFLTTAYEVFTTLSILLAPVMPYVSDEMYVNLTGEESVHLADWPKLKKLTKEEEELVNLMTHVREIVERTHALRKKHNIKVRQPLQTVLLFGKSSSSEVFKPFEELLKAELNVKNVDYRSDYKEFFTDESQLEFADIRLGETGDPLNDIPVYLDTNLTPELIAEGKARDLVREIQEARKAAGTNLDEKVTVYLPEWPEEFTNYIKEQTLATDLIKRSELKIERSA